MQENPTCPFPLVLAGGAGQAQPAPRANPARATASQGCQGAENTHGLGQVLWMEQILLPMLAHGANPTSSGALSVLARQVICLMGQRQGSLMRTFSSVYIWWGLLAFCSSSWAPFLSFLPFFFFLSSKGLVPTNSKHLWNFLCLCFPQDHHCLCCHAGGDWGVTQTQFLGMKSRWL